MAARKPAGPKPATKSSTEARSDGQKQRRVTEAQALIARRWAMARAKFERDPAETYASVARALDVSRQVVHAKAKAEGWEKKEASASRLAEAAHVVADQRAPAPLDDGLAGIAAIPAHPTRAPRSEPARDPLPPTPAPDYGAEAQAVAVQTRADVLTRHRTEWRVIRGLLQEAVRGRDYGKGKLAKIAAETLKTTQDGERKAYGLDVAEAPPPGAQTTVRVVVEREGSPPQVQVDRGDS